MEIKEQIKSVVHAVKSLSHTVRTYTKENRVTQSQSLGNVVTHVTEQKAEIVEPITELTINAISKTCHRCGRKLKTQQSKELGYGLICYRKHMESIKRKPLFDLPVYEEPK